jgi:undecaprenyl-diphosphatase
MTRRRLDVVAIVAGLVVFAVCAWIVRNGTVSAPERAVFRAINELPDGLSVVMVRVQLLGILGVGPVVALGAFLARRWRLGLAILVVTVLKLAIERANWTFIGQLRERPGTVDPGAIVRGNTPIDGVAFVSGHVILTTGIAWVLTPWLPGRWRWAPWAVVALVGFARIYLAAHDPLDVLGGFALGCVVGGVTCLLFGVPGADADLREASGEPEEGSSGAGHGAAGSL